MVLGLTSAIAFHICFDYKPFDSKKNTQLTQEDVIVIVPFESIRIAAAVPDVHEVQRDSDRVVAAAAGLDPEIGAVVWEAEGESK